MSTKRFIIRHRKSQQKPWVELESTTDYAHSRRLFKHYCLAMLASNTGSVELIKRGKGIALQVLASQGEVFNDN